MKREVFQITYMFLWSILSLGIAGNMDLDVETPVYIWVIYGILSILVLLKITYWIMKDIEEWRKENGEEKYY